MILLDRRWMSINLLTQAHNICTAEQTPLLNMYLKFIGKGI